MADMSASGSPFAASQATGRAGVLLIHGGAHAGWCWNRMRVLLDYPSIAIDLPGRERDASITKITTSDFVGAAVRAVEESGWQEVVVVAHSLGGVTACGLAHALPEKVRHLIFVASILPEVGRSLLDLAPSALKPLLSWGYRRAVDRNGAYMLPEKVARYLFCNDLDHAESSDLIERLCAEPPRVIVEPSRFAVPQSIPRTYVRPMHDHALGRSTQNRMIRLLGDVDVVDIDAGHNVMISRPSEIAALVNSVARRRLTDVTGRPPTDAHSAGDVGPRSQTSEERLSAGSWAGADEGLCGDDGSSDVAT